MKEAQTSNFLCALSPSNGKAKPLCGYQESTQQSPKPPLPWRYPLPPPHFPLSPKPQGHCELTSLSRDQKTESYPYSSNPLLSHHAIKYALRPLTSGVRGASAPCSNTALPAPAKGPINRGESQDSQEAKLTASKFLSRSRWNKVRNQPKVKVIVVSLQQHNAVSITNHNLNNRKISWPSINLYNLYLCKPGCSFYWVLTCCSASHCVLCDPATKNTLRMELALTSWNNVNYVDFSNGAFLKRTYFSNKCISVQ